MHGTINNGSTEYDTNNRDTPENVILHAFYDIVVMFDNTRRQKKKQVHNDNTECVDILKAIT